MDRICAPELLDQLPPEDPGALGSRRDLRRLNWWMGNPAKMAAALNRFLPQTPELQVLEIGAGDGHFLGQVLSRLPTRAARKTAVLLDQHAIPDSQLKDFFHAISWEAQVVTTDVFTWFQNCRGRFDAVLANLFLHHFSNQELLDLFEAIASRTDLFVAIEPRRAPLSLLAGKFLWAIGCNAVTRHDAVVSIRAGFAGSELTELWPKTDPWRCDEKQAGFSSHLFVARKIAAHP